MTDRLTYKQDLTHCGLKKTRHRLVILDILDHSDQPVTAEQIFARLQDRRIAINLSTVYRTLDTLVLNKLVTRLSITQDGRALHEYNRRVHRHYLVCQGCRKIIPIDGCPLADYSRQLEQETGFQISGHKPPNSPVESMSRYGTKANQSSRLNCPSSLRTKVLAR